MSKQPRKYTKAGRPAVDVLAVKKSVSMLPEVYQYLLQIGGGVLSHGIQTAAKHHETFSILNKSIEKKESS